MGSGVQNRQKRQKRHSNRARLSGFAIEELRVFGLQCAHLLIAEPDEGAPHLPAVVAQDRGAIRVPRFLRREAEPREAGSAAHQSQAADHEAVSNSTSNSPIGMAVAASS